MQRMDAPFTPFSYCQITNISVSDVASEVVTTYNTSLHGCRAWYCHSQAVVQERKRAWYTLRVSRCPKIFGNMKTFVRSTNLH